MYIIVNCVSVQTFWTPLVIVVFVVLLLLMVIAVIVVVEIFQLQQ